MKITVRVHAELQRHTGGTSRLELDLAPGAIVRDVVQALGIPEVEVYSYILDRTIASIDSALEDGNHLDLVPPIGGGV